MDIKQFQKHLTPVHGLDNEINIAFGICLIQRGEFTKRSNVQENAPKNLHWHITNKVQPHQLVDKTSLDISSILGTQVVPIGGCFV